MHVRRLELTDFRSYASVEVELEPGAMAFIGANGQGKTNLVEAIDYLATGESHRVSNDAPLVRAGCEQAIVRAEAVRGDRTALLELEITPGRSNRARINRAPLQRPRELVGVLRTVIFSPEDLALVKGDPSQRRQFLDSLLVLRTPRLAGVRADYDRVLRQRNTLLKSARQRRGVDLSTLELWDDKLVQLGGELTAARLDLLHELGPHLSQAYRTVATAAAEHRRDITATYRPSTPLDGSTPAEIAEALAAGLRDRHRDEVDRGVSLVGPHRDEVLFEIGDLPAKGYASHGESWSFALSLRLASFTLLAEDDDDPILILDDVFAELDIERREHLADLTVDAEQVLVTAAVADDVPARLKGERYEVRDGTVTRD